MGGHNQDERTFLYVLECAGRVKIGIAADARARVANLQLTCPLPIELRHERPFQSRTAARLAERALHLRFGAQRLHGEWFDMDADLAVAAASAVEESCSPVKMLGKPRNYPSVPQAAVALPERVIVGWDGKDEPTEDQMDNMTDLEWLECMRPLAEILDFSAH